MIKKIYYNSGVSGGDVKSSEEAYRAIIAPAKRVVHPSTNLDFAAGVRFPFPSDDAPVAENRLVGKLRKDSCAGDAVRASRG
jgi:hypothetical protein